MGLHEMGRDASSGPGSGPALCDAVNKSVDDISYIRKPRPEFIPSSISSHSNISTRMDTTGTPIPEMNIETLQKRLGEAHDAAETFQLLIHLSNKFLHVDPDRALACAMDANRLAKEEGNRLWQAQSLI